MIGLWRASDRMGRWCAASMLALAGLDGFLAYRCLVTGHMSLMVIDIGLTLLMLVCAGVNLHSGMLRRARKEIENELARRDNWWLN